MVYLLSNSNDQVRLEFQDTWIAGMLWRKLQGQDVFQPYLQPMHLIKYTWTPYTKLLYIEMFSESNCKFIDCNGCWRNSISGIKLRTNKSWRNSKFFFKIIKFFEKDFQSIIELFKSRLQFKRIRRGSKLYVSNFPSLLSILNFFYPASVHHLIHYIEVIKIVVEPPYW